MSGDNQLFIGRLPRGSRSRELEDVFYKYGKMTRCDVKQGIKMAYGFIEYEDKRDAEDALRGEHGRDFNGARIVVEWARGPKDPAAPREHRDRERFRHDDRRDYRRDDRSGRHNHGRSRSRSPRHSCRKSCSRSPDQDYHRKKSSSRSPDYDQ